MALRTLLATFVLLALPAGAAASTPHDLRGTWDCCGAGGAASQKFNITSMNVSTGAFTGNGGNQTYTYPITGTANGNSVTLVTGPYNQLPSYKATFTGTISADSKSMSGTWTTGTNPQGTWTATRATAPPPGGGGGGGGGAPPPVNIPGECVTTQTLLAACANPYGTPAVCGPSGTVLPQCSFPVDLPTVCGPSGTILVACVSQGPYIVACGGFGTILPQCNLPPPALPQVCGPSNTLLPPCTGANNPVVVCGGSNTALPVCNFGGPIDATPLGGGGSVDVTVGCPGSATSCSGTVLVESMRKAKIGSLTYEAKSHSQRYARAGQGLATGTTYVAQNGQRIGPIVPPLTSAQARGFGNANAEAFLIRAQRVIENYLGTQAHPPVRERKISDSDRSGIARTLSLQTGLPSYTGPDALWGSALVAGSGDAFAMALAKAVNEYVDASSGARPAAQASAKRKPRVGKTRVVKTFKLRLRRGARRTDVRVKLPRKVVRNLIREAGAGARTTRLRVIVSFKAKPRPVARFVDIRVRIKRR
jgi:hypothetical protein